MTAPGWFNPYREPRQNQFYPTLIGPMSLVTPPTGQIVTLGQACDQCRVAVGDDDDFINGLIADAMEVVERNIPGEAQMLTATYSVPVKGWWWNYREIKLPRPPLQSVTSITYTDTDGVTQTLSTSIYEVMTPWKLPGRVRRAASQTFPAHQYDNPWPITITFRAGYGTINDVPRSVKRAALLWIGAAYRNRGDVPADEKLWDAIQRLLDQAAWGSY